jgi:hypothetical protein
MTRAAVPFLSCRSGLLCSGLANPDGTIASQHTGPFTAAELDQIMAPGKPLVGFIPGHGYASLASVIIDAAELSDLYDATVIALDWGGSALGEGVEAATALIAYEDSRSIARAAAPQLGQMLDMFGALRSDVRQLGRVQTILAHSMGAYALQLALPHVESTTIAGSALIAAGDARAYPWPLWPLLAVMDRVTGRVASIYNRGDLILGLAEAVDFDVRLGQAAFETAGPILMVNASHVVNNSLSATLERAATHRYLFDCEPVISLIRQFVRGQLSVSSGSYVIPRPS